MKRDGSSFDVDAYVALSLDQRRQVDDWLLANDLELVVDVELLDSAGLRARVTAERFEDGQFVLDYSTEPPSIATVVQDIESAVPFPAGVL